MSQIVGRRVVVMLQLEFLEEMVTVQCDVFLRGLRASHALFQHLLTLGNLGCLGCLDGLGLMNCRNAVLDIAFGAQQ